MRKILTMLLIASITGCSSEDPKPKQDVTPKNNEAALTPMQQIFQPEMIGATVQYLEQFTGPPKNVSPDGQARTYKVNSCEVTAYIENEGESKSVSGLRLMLAPGCDGDVGKFIDNKNTTMLSQLSFSKFEELVGGGVLYYADCLSLCGNAFDPSVYAHWEGPRAADFLEMMIEVKLISNEALQAADQWESVMKTKETEDWILGTGFNCEPTKYSNVASKSFAAIRPEAITIGRGLPSPRCDQEIISTQASVEPNQLVVPAPKSECDYEYEKTLNKNGLVPKKNFIHGPIDEDFVDYACPYRITPPPGTPVKKGSVVQYRLAYEGS